MRSSPIIYTIFALILILSVNLLVFVPVDSAETPLPLDRRPTQLPTEAAPVPTAMPTATPTATPTTPPTPTATPELRVYLSDAEVDLLTRLLEAEIFGMGGEAEYSAGLSVLDTVFERLAVEYGGDTTVEAVVTRPGQFPPCVYSETGRVDTCGRAISLEPYEDLVEAYQQGEDGQCPGYLNYHSQEGRVCDCLIEGKSGWICFYNKTTEVYPEFEGGDR